MSTTRLIEPMSLAMTCEFQRLENRGRGMLLLLLLLPLLMLLLSVRVPSLDSQGPGVIEMATGWFPISAGWLLARRL